MCQISDTYGRAHDCYVRASCHQMIMWGSIRCGWNADRGAQFERENADGTNRNLKPHAIPCMVADGPEHEGISSQACMVEAEEAL